MGRSVVRQSRAEHPEASRFHKAPATFLRPLERTCSPSQRALNYLTAWQTGERLPLAFTLTDPTGAVLADMGIVAAGSSGSIAVYPSNNTNLVIDINGFFAPPASGGGCHSITTAAPCHAYTSQRSALDRGFSGTIVVPVSSPKNPCGLPSTSEAAFAFNATVYPLGSLPYLTLWPDGQEQPVVANLEADDGSVTSNMAIVPTFNGYIDAYAAATTQLSLDIMSYFAP